MQQNAANTIQNKNLKQHNAAKYHANAIQNKNLKQHNAAKCSKYYTKQKPKAA